MAAPSSNPLRRIYRRLHRLALDGAAALGVNVARSRDYYSPLPVRAELVRTRRALGPAERHGRGRVGRRGDARPARAPGGCLRGGAGTELPPYEEAKRLGYGPGFTHLDARLLYLTVRDLKPRRILEVGSGLSTFYMTRALERNRSEGAAGTITCVDPYSGDRVAGLPGVEVLRREVQDLDPEEVRRLEDGDLLFIDSTHVVKVGGDVPHLYLELLPRLRPGVVIHSHDIHFPYNTPYPAEEYVVRAKWPMVWTEAMLLQAFLAFNREFEILLAPSILRHEDEPWLARTMPGYRPVVPADYDTHAGSIWYRRAAG